MLEILVDGLQPNGEDDEWDYNDPEYLEDQFFEAFEEWFAEGEEWWDFHERDLTIQNINELLEERNTRQSIPIVGSSLYDLLKSYGYFIARDDSDTYIQLLKDKMSDKENNHNPENNPQA